MIWKFDDERAIYIQIIEQFKLMIASGIYEKGAKIEPVRDLSAAAGVNPNTMQKALAELEREGLVYSSRTSGRFVTEDEDVIKAAKKAFADKKISLFLGDMQKLGYSKNEVINLLNDYDMEVPK